MYTRYNHRSCTRRQHHKALHLQHVSAHDSGRINSINPVSSVFTAITQQCCRHQQLLIITAAAVHTRYNHRSCLTQTYHAVLHLQHVSAHDSVRTDGINTLLSCPHSHHKAVLPSPAALNHHCSRSAYAIQSSQLHRSTISQHAAPAARVCTR